MLKGYLKNNPAHQQRLEVYWSSDSVSSGLIFPLNSPLASVFRSGAVKIRERGVQDILTEKWAGKDINQDLAASTMVLGAGHMILIFAIMLVFYLVCLLVFMVEVTQSAVVKGRLERPSKCLENRPRRDQIRC